MEIAFSNNAALKPAIVLKRNTVTRILLGILRSFLEELFCRTNLCEVEATGTQRNSTM